MPEQILTMTPMAIEKAKEFMKKEQSGQYLRAYVQGGGCSGLSYGLAFDKELEEGDTLIDFNGVEVIIDSQSKEYLRGTELDYIENLGGAGFKFKNPNEKKSCACGHSFNV